jgi:hypothetical protein
LFLCVFDDVTGTDIRFTCTRVASKHSDLAQGNTSIKVAGDKIV